TRAPPVQAAVLATPDGAVEVRGVKPQDRIRGIRGAGDKLAILEAIPGVAAAPVLQGPALLRYGARDVSAVITGLDPDRHRRVSNIEKDMVQGRLEDLRGSANAIILGDALARRLGVQVGDTFTAVSPTGAPLSVKAVGLFRTGIQTVDQGHAFMLLSVQQMLQNRPNTANQILIRLEDVTRAEPLARQMVVGAILLVAAFGIYNIISTVVFEKTRDIAILKSLGFPEGDIQRLFLLQGVVVGLFGAGAGCVLGWLMVEGMGQVRFPSETPAGADRFILARDWRIYVVAGGFALLAAGLAALIPARRASRLDPVQVVRGAA
ncbi:MAG: ABC transporter permease, partial [Rubritepida sp.]|nr:ABC transporter permease [Rubritepida sp.]